MDSLETWLDVVVMGWIRLLYSASSQGLVRIKNKPDALFIFWTWQLWKKLKLVSDDKVIFQGHLAREG